MRPSMLDNIAAVGAEDKWTPSQRHAKSHTAEGHRQNAAECREAISRSSWQTSRCDLLSLSIVSRVASSTYVNHAVSHALLRIIVIVSCHCALSSSSDKADRFLNK